jgi:hypothetical protein
MVIRDDGLVELASKDDLEGMLKLDDCSYMEYVVQGESLVIRRSLSVQVIKRISSIQGVTLIIRYVV